MIGGIPYEKFICSVISNDVIIGTHIIHRTSEKIIVHSFKRAVPLFCVASMHPYCSYEWKLLGSSDVYSWPNTPVIYVTKGGLYECSIKDSTCKVVLQTIYDVQLKGMSEFYTCSTCINDKIIVSTDNDNYEGSSLGIRSIV